MRNQDEINREFAECYPGWDEYNLHTKGVRDHPDDANVKLVLESHPVVALLRHNEDVIGTRVDDVPRIDGEWVPVTKEVLQVACVTISMRVLGRVCPENQPVEYKDKES